MPKPEEPREPDAPETVWKSLEKEPIKMQDALTTDQLCAMARSREKFNARVNIAVAAVAAALAAGFLYNVYRIEQPWIRLGQAWTLGVIVYLFGVALQQGHNRMDTGEPCARFLERQHETRRLGYLRIRRRLWLIVPGMVASWFGGGPLAAAKAGGFDPSTWLYRFCAGPWLFFITAVALVLVWLAFGKAAEHAARDRDEIRPASSQRQN